VITAIDTNVLLDILVPNESSATLPRERWRTRLRKDLWLFATSYMRSYAYTSPRSVNATLFFKTTIYELSR
jgi:hypothetical protein